MSGFSGLASILAWWGISTFALVLVLALVISACGEEEDFDDPGADERSTVEVASPGDGDDSDGESDDGIEVPPLFEASTHEDASDDRRITLIRYGQRPVAHMDALLQGELGLNGECLGVQVPESSGEFIFVVWPYGYAAGVDGDRATLLDEQGDVVAHEGDLISMGGGHGPDQDGEIAEIAPDDCIAGDYWYSGDPPQLAADWEARFGDSGTTDPDATPHVQTEKEAREQDAQMYADSFGVSLDEAMRRLELQSLDGFRTQELEEQEAHRFGGLYLQHEPEFKVVVLMTDGDEDAVREYIDNPEIEEILEVRSVDVSYAELLEAQHDTMELMHELGLLVSGGTNVQENRVELFASDPALVQEVLEAEGVDLPDYVVIVSDDGSVEPADGS